MTHKPFLAPCRDAFDRGQSDRQPHRLKTGAYKIGNVRDDLTRSLRTMDAIRAFKCRRRHSRRPAPLGCCTSEEMPLWIKRQPEALAHQLGYDLLPAIAALGGDGVPDADVADALCELRPEIDALVQRCEWEHARLQSAVRYEYTALRAGRSALCKLMEDARSLAEAAYQHYVTVEQERAAIEAEFRLETL